MNNADSRCLTLEYGKAADHGLVDRVRTLAAAENQNGGSSSAFGGNLKESLTNRNACDLAVAEVFRGLLEVHRGAGDEARDQPVGESRHDVRLERQRRDV